MGACTKMCPPEIGLYDPNKEVYRSHCHWLFPDGIRNSQFYDQIHNFPTSSIWQNQLSPSSRHAALSPDSHRYSTATRLAHPTHPSPSPIKTPIKNELG